MHGGPASSPGLRPHRRARRRPVVREGWWVAVPAVGLALLIAVLLLLDPIRGLTQTTPLESVAVERVVLDDGEIELHIRNDGRSDVTLAQVMVNDAFWQHDVDDRALGRLDGATVEITYPWHDAVPVHLALVTGTGTVIEYEIENPSETPHLDLPNAGTLGLVGLLVAPVPIALGLAWLPALRRSAGPAFGAAMAFTVGLLAFLLVDTMAEGLEAAAATPGVLDGVGLFAVGALVVFTVLALLGTPPRRPRSPSLSAASATPLAGSTPLAPAAPAPEPHLGDGVRLAWLVATGIGLHNLGEGLAVGAAVSTGEVALGTALVVGFAAHNATEGVAIAGPLQSAPSGTRRRDLFRLAGLVTLAGVPVLPGLWLGGFVLPSGWAVLAFGVATGAIAQVILAVVAWLRQRGITVTPITAGAFGAAVLLLYLTGIATA